jgi:hypothetical protein
MGWATCVETLHLFSEVPVNRGWWYQGWSCGDGRERDEIWLYSWNPTGYTQGYSVSVLQEQLFHPVISCMRTMTYNC